MGKGSTGPLSQGCRRADAGAAMARSESGPGHSASFAGDGCGWLRNSSCSVLSYN